MATSLSDDLKKMLLAGIGATTIAAEKTKSIIDELIKKGELSVEQGKELLDKLSDKGEETVKKGKAINEELKRNVKEKMNEQNLKSVLNNIEKLGKDELETIKKKLEEMEKANNDAQNDGEKK